MAVTGEARGQGIGEKLGFEKVSRGPDEKYARGGLVMELDVAER